MKGTMLTNGSLARFAEELNAADDVSTIGERYLEGAREFVDVEGLGFDVIHPTTHALQYMDADGVSPFFLSRYEETGRAVDPLLPWVIERRTPVAQWHVMSRREWCRHEIFRDVYHLHDFVSVVMAPVLVGEAVIGVLGFGTSARLRESDLTMCEALGLIVGMALTSARARASLESQRAKFGAALDVCDEAVVITDVRSGERWLNQAARALLGRVAATRDRSLIDDIMAAHSHCEAAWTSTEQVDLKHGGSTLLEVRTVSSPTDPQTIISLLALRDQDSTGRMPAGIAALLSPREREVAECVAQGMRTQEIAERLSISAHTVKQYLKSVYRKLGISSRVDVARLVGGAPMQAGSGRASRR